MVLNLIIIIIIMLYINNMDQVVFRTKPDSNDSQMVYYYNFSTLALPTSSLKHIIEFKSNQLRLRQIPENGPLQFNLILDYLSDIEDLGFKSEADGFQHYFEELELNIQRRGLNLTVTGITVPNLIDLIESAKFQSLNALKISASLWKVILV